MKSWSVNYLHQLETTLENWEFTESLIILRKKVFAELGAAYFRVRIRLLNDEILEISEYVEKEESKIVLKSYSYHWQDKESHLISRWDNAPYHPQVKDFPHHFHSHNETNIFPSEPMNLKKVLEKISAKIQNKET